ncbi:MAG: hypothetical protein COB53_13270, partial [Elusimicrobia bacterium]
MSTSGIQSPPQMTRERAIAAYQDVRSRSDALTRPLKTEDYVVQSMPDASPVKWHLAHTSWFFEGVLLKRFAPEISEFDPHFKSLFNSYYESLGPRWARADRGLLTRPSVDEIAAYRRHIDEHMLHLLDTIDEAAFKEAAPLLELGLAHEEQHQELMVTDFKHLLALNPLRPIYHEGPESDHAKTPAPAKFRDFPGGLYEIGHNGDGFAYDNESPQHKIHLQPFALADRPLSNAEVLAFIEDGGYQDFRFWFSDAWTLLQQQGWEAPLYWEKIDDVWHSYTLAGRCPINPGATAAHLSFYEAAAIARWAGARLPTEFEWEVAAGRVARAEGRFLNDGLLAPGPAR